MNSIKAGVCASLLALSFIGASVKTADAAPFSLPNTQTSAADIQTVQFRRDDDRRNVQRRDFQRRDVQRRDVQRGGFERRGSWGYYNGRRGYREARRGYRQYNGWWFPPSAFVAGAILGGAFTAQPQMVPAPGPVRLSAAHLNWCQERWRSYRVSDDSYLPFNGPRQRCVSPYGR